MQFKHIYDVKFIKKIIPNDRLGFCGSNDVNFITIGLVEVFLNCIKKLLLLFGLAYKPAYFEASFLHLLSLKCNLNTLIV
jgi:hypothetical protein